MVNGENNMKGKSLGIYLIILMLVPSWISCTNKHNEEIAALVNYWKGKEIIFPMSSTFMQSKDTVDFSLEGQYKILSYVDSTGCVSCKLKLSEWKELIEVIDSVNPSVKVLFFFAPEKTKDVYSALRQSYFNHPVCIDLKDSLNTLNHFPSNMTFQTFLLDKDNKVLAIGNPIHNPKVKELYFNIIQGKEIQPDDIKSAPQTSVNVDKVSMSLRHFDWQEEQKTSFIIKNVGSKPLFIQDVNTSCGCTTVSYSREPVQPGKEATLVVTYKAEHPEYFNKTITVYCNAESSPIRLTISGDAK